MRIISLSPSTTEVLFALDTGGDIIANTIYCDYPEAAKKIRKVGSWIRINTDEIRKLKPDIIFTSTIVQQKIHEKLRECGLPVVHVDPRTLTAVYQSIEEMGRQVHKRRQAHDIVHRMKKQEELYRKHPSGNVRVYIEEWFNPPMMSGNWVPDIVTIAGGQYGIVRPGELSRTVSLEAVKAYDPDIIILSYCGFGPSSNPNHILKRPGWESLRAVREKRIYSIDETILNRPGPRILQSVIMIRSILTKQSP